MEPFVALDWGTTRVRAALVAGDGNVLEERIGESGVGVLDANGFEVRFDELTQGWNSQIAIACGMIGSRQGWLEAPYVTCPTKLSDLNQHLASQRTDKGSICIVPGLSIKRTTGNHDVMRGEETQLAGLLAQEPNFSGTVVLPGTHSKWVSLQNGAVVDFLSYLTGDLYEAVSTQTLLRHSINNTQGEWNETSFVKGVDVALQSNGAIWSRLFGIRADALIEGAGDGSQAEFLSGLLVGSEFASAQKDGFKGDDLVIIGGRKMITLYEVAAKAAGYRVRSYTGTDLVWPALTAIAQSVQKAGV